MVCVRVLGCARVGLVVRRRLCAGACLCGLFGCWCACVRGPCGSRGVFLFVWWFVGGCVSGRRSWILALAMWMFISRVTCRTIGSCRMDVRLWIWGLEVRSLLGQFSARPPSPVPLHPRMVHSKTDEVVGYTAPLHTGALPYLGINLENAMTAGRPPIPPFLAGSGATL